ncbi:hypothetical protein IWZ03DRAFT_363830 [Phyllosticta citriasiana]|uniref:Uncharacterized protein n=1 Tax=Phyllosticta citriasiana TaxID=595635 RepID=A0ABR1K7Z3_9PEZI
MATGKGLHAFSIEDKSKMATSGGKSACSWGRQSVDGNETMVARDGGSKQETRTESASQLDEPKGFKMPKWCLARAINERRVEVHQSRRAVPKQSWAGPDFERSTCNLQSFCDDGGNELCRTAKAKLDGEKGERIPPTLMEQAVGNEGEGEVFEGVVRGRRANFIGELQWVDSMASLTAKTELLVQNGEVRERASKDRFESEVQRLDSTARFDGKVRRQGSTARFDGKVRRQDSMASSTASFVFEFETTSRAEQRQSSFRLIWIWNAEQP